MRQWCPSASARAIAADLVSPTKPGAVWGPVTAGEPVDVVDDEDDSSVVEPPHPPTSITALSTTAQVGAARHGRHIQRAGAGGITGDATVFHPCPFSRPGASSPPPWSWSRSSQPWAAVTARPERKPGGRRPPPRR